jgi:hypothetical protein
MPMQGWRRPANHRASFSLRGSYAFETNAALLRTYS